MDFTERLEQENKQLKEQLAIREKALELACETICNNIIDEEEYYAKVEYAKSYFIEQAKENQNGR